MPIAILCAYVTSLLVPTSPPPKPASAATYNVIEAAAITEESTTIGIADSDMYNKSEEEIIASFDQMEALGVDTLRVVVAWAAIAPAEPGSALEALYPEDWETIDFIISQAQERGMSVVAVLNATPYYGGQDDTGCLGCVGVAPDAEEFAAFAGEVAARFESLYPGVVSAYEVWNEPNAVTSWSPAVDPAAYTEVLKAVYTAIKDANGILGADPSDPLVVAGVLGAVISFGNLTMDPATFVEEMYANGAQGYFDALSYHPYNYDVPLSEQSTNYVSPLQMLLEVRQLMLENGDDEIKIWATEYGLPTSIVSYEEQADFIEDFLTTWANGLSDEQLAQLPEEYQELVDTWQEWIGPAFVYTLWDRQGEEDTEQGSLGVFYYDEEAGEWAMKPAAQIIKDLIDSQTPDAGDDLATALAASLQKLVEQVATSVAAALQTTVVAAVTQSVQQIGTQIGNALANALAAWAASFSQNTTTSATLAAVTAIDTAAVAEQAVNEAVTATEAASPETADATTTSTDVDEAAKSATAAATPAETTEEPLSTTTAEAATSEAVSTPTPTDASATDEPTTMSDEADATPVNRQESDDDSTQGTDEKKAGHDEDDRRPTGGNRTKGTVKNGTSVEQRKARLGGNTATTDTTTDTTGTPDRDASADASSSATA